MPASHTSGQSSYPCVAGIQPAERRRKGATLSLARRATEPGYLVHSALTCMVAHACHPKKTFVSCVFFFKKNTFQKLKLLCFRFENTFVSQIFSK